METNNHIVIIEPPNIQIVHVTSSEMRLAATYGSKIIVTPPIVNVVHVDNKDIQTVNVTESNQLKVLSGKVANFTDLFDTPKSYTGNAGKVVAVKGNEAGVEFVESTASDDAIIYAIIFGS